MLFPVNGLNLMNEDLVGINLKIPGLPVLRE